MIRAGGKQAGARVTPDFFAIMGSAVRNNASDIHIKVGKPPILRLDGLLRELNLPPLEEARVTKELATLCIAAGVEPLPEQASQLDFSHHEEGLGRFRCHLYRQQGSWAATLRVIPEAVPSFVDLRLPPIATSITELDRGIVLITGATGQGKSTTAASILASMAKSRSIHILTIENPIEFVLPGEVASVSQRAVGIDVESYEQALEAAFREDPDVLFIDELRSVKALEVALHAGESGHLCISTIHTADALSTISRIGSMVAEDLRRSILARLADSLRVVVSQRLVPLATPPGRVLAAEVMVATATVRDVIRDPGKHKSLPSVISREGPASNAQTFDQALMALVRANLISLDSARGAASSPDDLTRAMRLS
jgi:twitching motility protein PilT